MPPPDLSGLRCLVLGSTSGIGRATALSLAASGADVIVHGRRSREAAKAVSAECLRLGSARSAVLMADLADRDAGDRLIDEAWTLWDGLDAWLHLAGADTLTGPGADLHFDAKLDLLWSVDVVSTLRLCRRVGALMKQQGRGTILTMGWDQAETGMEGDSGELFAATKGAIMCLTRSLSLSLAPEVRVNCLAPGWIKTSWGEQASDDWQRRAVSEAPLARWGTPDDVAEVARFLVGPSADFLTGQIVRINGGAIR
ncbi:SDR family NAD(P)-dependent oxidoreductase [Tautonia marina]|uniref:SDR family NAD(P)-dependent oxidoreductase n=1 Tax=Tautonia marina TaxID=2653855 RepID=UPI0012603F99|nr:SDR family oxidoreductase [Tautonia marina]